MSFGWRDISATEIQVCSKCNVEIFLYYDFNDKVVSQTKCKCNQKIKLIEGQKPLDYAIKKLSKRGKK